MSDTSLVFNLVARDRTGQTLNQVKEKFSSAAEGISAGVGAALGAGIMNSFSVQEAQSKLAAQLGLTEAESGRIGKAAGQLYAHAYGDSMDEVNAAVGSVMSSIKGMSSASSADLQTATQAALNFAKTFDIEVDRAVQSAGTLINSGLAKNSTQAFDLITAASQKVPAQLREDVLDASDEYSQFFNTLGYSGEQAFSLLVDASKKGTFGIDKAGDAIKEFTIRSTDMSTSSQAAYKAVGLDARSMSNDILAGGSRAQGATQKIISGLLGIKDPSKQAQAAIALFGTPLEDLNVKDIPAFLTSLKGASGSMDGFGGAAKRSGDTLRDNGATALEEFKRKAMSTVTDVGGSFAQFAMDNQQVFTPLLYTLTALAVTVMVVRGAMAAYAAVSAIVTGAHALMTASTWSVIGGWIRMNAVGLMAYARIAGAAVVSAATTAASWTGSALAAMGTWILSVLRAATVAVAQYALMALRAGLWAAITAAAWTGTALLSIGIWILGILRAGAVAAVQFTMMALRAVAWAAVMAAQWLIAMGPIGWVIAIIILLVVVIVAKWDLIKRYTLIAWNWVWAKVKVAVAGILAAVSWLGRLPGMVAAFFSRMASAAISRALALVAWVRGLPGRINAGIVGMNSLLVSKGRAVVQGLWSGISAMGGWIRGRIMGWARSVIPGPIAKALGIASPSKVTTAQGRWIARGLIEGLTGSGPQVRSAATKLSDIVSDSMRRGARKSRALNTIHTGTSQLMRLATREAAVAARLKATNKDLADLLKKRDALAADVRKGVLDSANITAVSGEGPVTGSTILANLQDKVARAKEFARNLMTLRKKGVRSDLIAEIAQAGVEQGSSAATAMALADKRTVSQINATQGQLVTAAGQAGNVAGNAMYGAGIQAAQGIVRGLKKEQAAIERQMLSIAQGMQRAIKKALGIRSPSRLMADTVGRFIPPGIVRGMAQTTPQLDAAMHALVKPEQPAAGRPLTATGMAPQMGAQSGGLVRVRIDFTGADGEMKRMFRRMVRVDGRGRVQILTDN
ncbi:phage tail tape measure protein [Streptomyces sp. NPDC058459]|uniref:phage tail tape measure protein n=1 Tax=Streptomyces sp. NPDC058459 TaxID=3346508 RepID=UPI0036674865